MNQGYMIWDQLANVDRRKTIITAHNYRVKSNYQYKDIILREARDNYLIAAKQYCDMTWSSFKVAVQNRHSSFLCNNHSWPKIVHHSTYYDYNYVNPITKKHNEQIWVSFTSKYLGSGYKNTEWLQESAMATEFYEMALGITEYEKSKLSTLALNETVIWFDIVRGSQASPETYASQGIPNTIINPDVPNSIVNEDIFDVKEYINPDDACPVADFISIDAINHRNKNNPYSLKELQHLFVKALVGFETCVSFRRKIIHTGNWGAGSCNNDPALTFWVQVLVAKLVGITEIHFWGAKDITDDIKIKYLVNQIFPQSSIQSADFIDLYNKTRWYFNVDFTVREIFSPLLFPEWTWLNDDKNWICYDSDIQQLLTKELIDTTRSVYFWIGRDNYQIAHIKGWYQLNIRTQQRHQVRSPVSY
jgi:hypothetical protein